MVIQEVGRSSTKLCDLKVGDEVADIVGPLGTPSHIENYGTVVCAGGGIRYCCHSPHPHGTEEGWQQSDIRPCG